MSIAINNILLSPSQMIARLPRAQSVGEANETECGIKVRNQLKNLKDKIKEKNHKIQNLIEGSLSSNGNEIKINQSLTDDITH